MVGTDGIAHIRVLLILLGQLHAKDCVRQFGVGLRHFANIVQQTGTLGQLGIETQFRSHGSSQIGHLAAVLQQVLAVRGTILHAAHHAHQLMVHIVDAQVDAGTLTYLGNLLLNLFAGLGNHLFNTGGMDAAVGHQFMQRQAGNFAANGVEAAEDNSIGRVVDNDLHTGERFQGANVAALAANDTAFDLLIFKVEHANGVLHSCFSGGALDGLYDNLLGLLVGGYLGLLHDVHDACGGIGPGLLGHHLHQVLLGFLGSHAGNVFQFLDALIVYLLHLGLTFAQHLNLVVEVGAHLLELLALLLQVSHLLVEGVFALFQLALLLAKSGVAFVHLLLVLALHLDELLLGLQDLVFLYNLAFLFGVFQHLVASFNHFFALGQQFVVFYLGGSDKACSCANDNTDNNSYYYVHVW